jgi:hypothetical protein
LNHKYTITKGEISTDNKHCNIPFALIFEENGLYFLDTFLEKDFFEDSDFSKSFDLKGTTEKGFEIEVKNLTFTLYQNNNFKAKFICRNFIKLTEPEIFPEDEEENEEETILFLEIEGFHTKFAHYTEIKKYRFQTEVDKHNNFSFDHTSCALHIQIEGFRENYFHLNFNKSKKNDNILIDFTQRNGYGLLTFKHYESFKKQLIGFLSLLNGGNVSIRKELTGNSYKPDGSDAQIVYIYSFSKISNSNTSGYVPINEYHSESSLIFGKVFLNCFNNFYHNDKIFDLLATIASINSSYSTSGIKQAYSILITALEKFCSNHQKSIGNFEETHIDNELWNSTLKASIFNVLDENKRIIDAENITAYSIFKSKLGQLNRRQNSTVQKMFDLLQFGSIPINDNVESLINEERHNAVHNGEFGADYREMYINYQKLDHILRDLILNIINYRGIRKSICEYATDEEKLIAYPSRQDPRQSFIITQH